MRVLLLACRSLAVALAVGLAPAQDLLLRSKTVVLTPDTVLSDGELLVRGGKIAFTGAEIPTEARAASRRIDFGDATIVPGFVLAHTVLAQEGDLGERVSALTPELRAAEAFDPFQDELSALPRWAITSGVLAPSSRNVAGGIAALVKPGKSGGRVADDDLYLKLSLALPARDQERPPTSLMGGVELLRTALQTAKNPTAGGADLRPLREALQRSRRVFVHVDTYAEIVAALELGKEFGLELVLVGAAEAGKCIAQIKAAGAAVVLTALAPEMRLAQQSLPGELALAGIRVAFTSQQPQWLRTTAALAVAHGMPRRAALAALTRTPAELIGRPERVGSLRIGCDADLAVFSGDPLDLTSRLLAVYVGGELLHGAVPARDHQEAK